MTYPAPAGGTGFLRIVRELRRIRARLRDLRHSTQIGLWQYHPLDNSFHASREALELVGLPKAEGKETVRRFLRRIHRDDRHLLLSALGRVMQEAEPHLNIVLRLTAGNPPMPRIRLHAWRTDQTGQACWFGIIDHLDVSLTDSSAFPADGQALDMVGGHMPPLGGWQFTLPLGGWQFNLRQQQLLMTPECANILELPASGSLVRADAGDFRTTPSFAPVQHALAHCLSDGTPFDRVERTLTAQGREIWLRVIGQPVRDDSGTIGVIQVASQDITLALRVESALGQLSRRLARAIDIQCGACLMLDPGFHITYVNRKATRLLKTSRKSLIGQRLSDVFQVDTGDIDTDIGAGWLGRLSAGEALTREACRLSQGAWFDLQLVCASSGIEVYFSDITARKETEAALRLSEERFKIIARATSDGIFDWDKHNDTLWTNEGMVELFDFPARENRGGKAVWLQCIHPEDRQNILAGFTEADNTEAADWTSEYRLRRRDGSYAMVQNRTFFIRDSQGKTIRAICAITDITEKKNREAERQKYEQVLRQQASLLDRARDAISVSDLEGRIFYWNKGAQRLFGWSAAEAIGRKKVDLIVDDRSSYERGMHTVLEHDAWAGEIRKKTHDGKIITVEAHWTLIRDEAGLPQAILAIDTDISRRKEAEREIERLAFFDTLTHLPNRRLLMDRLQQALDGSGRNNRIGALIFIDLDNFKRLNDTLGHDKGDQLLQQVARRLERCVRRNNTVARLGGDEFVILIDDLSEVQREAMTQARAVAENVLAAFSGPFQLDDHSIHSTPSLGVTLFRHRTEHHHLTTVEELLKRADLAMYQAKASGRNAVRFFDPEMQSVMNARVALEMDLRHGMQREEFLLQYQPQADASGRITGTEALVRWQHPERGVISPNLFIPLAEETGLILSLGNWILHAACQQLAQWASQPQTAHLTMAVNVSPRQFRHPDFVQQVTDALLSTGANPRQLKLELTESLLIENIESTLMKMAALKKLGVSFSLDDFGTGYSSLAYLKRLPIDQLKIDQSFVKDVLENPNDAAIARTIVALGQMLGLEVIAEGVETEDQRAFLARNGCNAYQGYLFSQPRPGESFFH